MTIKEIEAKSILRKHKKIDSWFISHYGLNLYRGCTHNCVYCDGRSQRYYVDGEFVEDVSVKVNGKGGERVEIKNLKPSGESRAGSATQIKNVTNLE